MHLSAVLAIYADLLLLLSLRTGLMPTSSAPGTAIVPAGPADWLRTVVMSVNTIVSCMRTLLPLCTPGQLPRVLLCIDCIVESQVLGMGWNAIKNWANSMAERHPWSLFEAAKANDTARLEVHHLVDHSGRCKRCACDVTCAFTHVKAAKRQHM